MKRDFRKKGFEGRPRGQAYRDAPRPPSRQDDVPKRSPLPNSTIDWKRLLVRNSTPGRTCFEMERTTRLEGVEYREIDPKRSKLAAAVMKGGQQFGFKQGSRVLYLGSSHGYTPSFVSDMIGPEGILYCVDMAPVVMRDLLFIAKDRKNMVPVLASAADVDLLSTLVTGADVVFQDIAQRDQVEIFLRNIDRFLLPGGTGLLSLKAGSIDVTRRPSDIFKEVRAKLEAHKGIVIIEYRELSPFEQDHAFFGVKKKDG